MRNILLIALMFVLCSVMASAANVTMVYYTMENFTNSNYTIVDNGIYGHNGSMNLFDDYTDITDTSTTTPGGVSLGNALYFDGVDDFIQLENSTAEFCALEDLSISVWVKFEDKQDDMIVFYADDRYNLQIRAINPDEYRVRIADDVGNYASTFEEDYASGTWYHIAAYMNASAGETFSASNTAIYINGVRSDSKYSGARGSSACTGVNVGRTYTNEYQGYIDELRVFNYTINSYDRYDLYYWNDVSLSRINITANNWLANYSNISSLNVTLNITVNLTGDDATCYLYNNETVVDTVTGISDQEVVLMNDTSLNTSTQKFIPYYITCDNGGAANTTETLWINVTNGVTINIRDTETDALITTSQVNVSLISDTYTYELNTLSGVIPYTLISPTLYTLFYTAQGYDSREFIVNIGSVALTNITLYLSSENNTDQIVTTVYDDTTLVPVTQAYVYVLRYVVDTNSYVYETSSLTDPEGKCYFNLVMGDEYYKFVVEYPQGTQKLETQKFIINSNTLSLKISISDPTGETFFKKEGVSASLKFLKIPKEFSVTWTDSDEVADRYCLYIKKYGYYSQEVINTSCSTSHAGSIELGGLTENVTYYALFTARIDGDERTLASAWKEYIPSSLGAGRLGLFLSAGLVIIISLISSVHYIGLILGVVVLFFAKLTGILQIDLGIIIGVFAVITIVVMLIKSKR